MNWRVYSLLTVFVFASGCAKIRPERPWPAKIIQLAGFDAAEEVTVISALTSFNETSGRTIVEIENSEAGYPITLEKKDPPTDKPFRAGLATYESSQCKIEISPRVFSQYPNYLKSVLWHEMGHCAGLEHSEDQEDIMFHTSSKFENYSDASLHRFFDALFSIVSLQ